MSFLQFIYPARCISCDEVLAPVETGICTKCLCEGKVVFAEEPVCLKCGRGIGDDTEEYCNDCKKKKHYFTAARGIFFYTGGVKKGIYRFKYSGKRVYARAYAQYALENCGKWLSRIMPDYIVPVPMYKPKERERGYNQAKAFARALVSKTDIPYLNCLERIRSTSPLKLLNPEQRKKNIKGAFIIGKADIKYKRILLVDDIYTTGATVDECAKVLLAAGASEVFVFTVCTGTERMI